MQDVHPSIMKFLKTLAKNNDRDWFKAHKAQYQEAREKMITFSDACLSRLEAHDDIETSSGKKALYRIYRDVRFSKDKSPYNKHFSAYYRRATNKLRGGYYLRIEPGNSMIAGGFWGPNKEDLALIRSQIDIDESPLRKSITSKRFMKFFGELEGSALKTAPKGWPKNHASIDLLRMKQFLAIRRMTDKEVHSKQFLQSVDKTFRALRPFFDAMSLYLTTDLNGEDIY